MYFTRTFLICLSALTFSGCATVPPATPNNAKSVQPLPASIISSVGALGNEESYSVRITKPLPKNFINIVSDLEERFQSKWDAFDQESRGKEVYYGIVRGNAFGEFKAAIEKDSQTVSIIFLYKQGLSGYGVSTPKISKYTIKGNKITFSTTQKARDIWGPLIISITAEALDNMRFVSGTFTADHGMFGKYRGKFYGIHLGNKENLPAPSINNGSLIDQIVLAAKTHR